MRIVVLVPLAGYLFLSHHDWAGILVSIIIILSDILDGYIAKKLKQVTNIGAYMDATGDNLFLAVLFFSFLYLGYIDFAVIALLAAHRFTRLALALYIGFYGKGFYTPLHIKATGFIPMLYVFFVPLIFHYLGKDSAKFITIFVAASTYVFLVTSAFIAIYKFKRGQIKLQKLKKIPVRKIVREKKDELIKKHKLKKAARKRKRILRQKLH